ncbi:hypothetical protein ID866_10153 [Astraeus odoratus]|nr:hypothetical protein ID866_10153 [Astraeus odoratus]
MQAFHLDMQKVSFALSFLKGITLTWFKPDLLDNTPGTDPAWVDNYSNDAKHQLNNLLMKDGSHINKYIIEFNCLATQVCGYGEDALHHMFYNGLLDRIKDEIAHIALLLIWRIFLQAVQYLLQHLLLVFCWQREEPSAPILLYS